MARMIRVFVLLCALLVTSAANADTRVYRCVGAHGEVAFSGMPCSTTNMTVEPGTGATDDGHAQWLNSCATSARDLRDRVAAAFDSDDVNLLGGLFLWRGVSNRTAYRRMRKLRQLVDQPLAGLSLDGAPRWQADSGGYGALPTDANTWLSVTVAGDNHQPFAQAGDGAAPMVQHQYALVQRNACVWLTF